ncbi:HAD family hydrolase [Segetibacter sp. 3557_3]|uniref:heavy metal translocating P-type ATPase n=1 Tax=Segetibacter sp. 3557_3 TaxID=2547429 RepID=UPI00105849C9|nr:heavy metal translocating P-type ATPase metal-binding domain-containing protein [Segetibacter sp. 3557_3]TDH24649.1 HAD family hydrolase [Segetibacter sp. 3557_3]
MKPVAVSTQVTCFHCGEDCGKHPVVAQELQFCCEGCKMVYEILNQGGLCDYYNLSKNPGSRQTSIVRENKFAFLDDPSIAQPLIAYSDDTQTHVSFYLPQMHCSSCLWLLENLFRLNQNIISCKVNFTRKEAEIIFNHREVSLRSVAELLTSIGYEPYISFSNIKDARPGVSKAKIYKLGVAGFCFANIMLLSFPEYLGIDGKEVNLVRLFRYLNLLLSFPVFFYCATEFYQGAWRSLKHKFLNIDAPIVLAIWVTFARSLYEVLTGTGSGYFDSMTGIVFFMLVGRILQDKTYAQLSFDRDYTAYFPIAVTRLNNNGESSVALPDIKLNDTLRIHHQELIPADGILTRGKALIDYSFVTGESLPVVKEMGEIIYAGGRQTGSNVEMLVIKEVAQSYLTKLWNRDELKSGKKDEQRSFVHLTSRYFTWVVFGIAAITAAYWLVNDPTKVANSVTAVMIIACPCALLLSNTFTNGNILSMLGRNQFYLRNAQTIENIAKANHIVFDKTGTLTNGASLEISYEGELLTPQQQQWIALLASQSAHPLSKAIAEHLGDRSPESITGFTETGGLGLRGSIAGKAICMGSKKFVLGNKQGDEKTAVYVSIDRKYRGRFIVKNHYRENIVKLFSKLRKGYSLSVLSGDNAGEKDFLQNLLGKRAGIYFHQGPHDKLNMIKQLQSTGKKVIMVGDGLNDAGALKQADAGIAVSDNCNNFTPASDAIIQAEKLPLLHKFIRLCRINKRVVVSSFIISILYNVAGIYFAVQGNLSPMVAAILMPASSLSIILISFAATNLAAWKLGLK